MMKLIVASLLLGVAVAKCPNACSGHGDCGSNDACTCYNGFQGGDCSERVCMYNWAWVTTANGDLNFDGDVYDGTVYTQSSPLNSANLGASAGVGGPLLLTQAAPGGTWESWPYFGGAEEGHFYMECSNRGLCDRQKGDCMCFDGYEGTSCNRMVCPEDCNGHGTCVAVSYFDSSYDLWDKDMARSCKCDPGYTGPACQTRQCPHGNDVLTKDNEMAEVQYVDIYANCDGASPDSGCPSLASTSVLAGYARLTFTDHFGESYTTDPFAVMPMGAASQTTGSGAQAALRALPNNVTSSTIAVEAQYCEKIADGGPTFNAQTGATTDDYTAWRIPASATAGSRTVVIKNTTQVVPYSTTAIATTFNGDTAVNVHALDYPHCVRLKVTFNDMPGSHADLVADIDDVTFAGRTDSQWELDIMKTATTKTPDLIAGSDFTAKYNAPGENAVAIAAATVTRGTPTKIEMTAAGAFNNGENFYPGQKVKVECTDDSGTRNLGYYTVSNPTAFSTGGFGGVAAEGMNADYLYVDEYVLPCTYNNLEAASYGVTSVQHVVQFNAVVSSAAAAFDPTTIQMAVGDRLRFAVASGLTYNFDATVTQITSFATTTASTTFATGGGYVIIGAEDEAGALLGTAGDGSSPTLAEAASALDGGATTSVSVQLTSAGTKENNECGDRGLCEDDGTCKCFAGYTGDSCSIQKSIAM